MNRLIVTAFLLLSSCLVAENSLAGDYSLTICDSAAIKKKIKGCREKFPNDAGSCESWQDPRSSHTLQTPEQVLESSKQFFAGEQPKIKVLSAYITNGQFEFCSRADKTALLNGLLELRSKGVTHNKKYLKLFIGYMEN